MDEEGMKKRYRLGLDEWEGLEVEDTDEPSNDDPIRWGRPTAIREIEEDLVADYRAMCAAMWQSRQRLKKSIDEQ